MNVKIKVLLGIFLGVLIISFLYHGVYTKEEEPKVKVLSKFGCIETTDNEKVFEVRQRFTREILGYELVRCG